MILPFKLRQQLNIRQIKYSSGLSEEVSEVPSSDNLVYHLRLNRNLGTIENLKDSNILNHPLRKVSRL